MTPRRSPEQLLLAPHIHASICQAQSAAANETPSAHAAAAVLELAPDETRAPGILDAGKGGADAVADEVHGQTNARMPALRRNLLLAFLGRVGRGTYT